MSEREVVLTCTNRGQHEVVELLTYTFHDAVEPSQYVHWSPVSKGETMTVPCTHPRCTRSYELGNARGARLIGAAERMSRIDGRVVRDLSLEEI